MSMMADASRPVTGGVDTHKDVHVAAVVDHLGGVLATASFANTAQAHTELGQWLTSFGPVALVGVEGTGSYGAGLARSLRAAGTAVVEINRPDRSERRRHGKSDVADAIAAARHALAGRHAGTPKAGDGIVESVRMLSLARRSAVGARTQAANQINALVDTAPAGLHERWSQAKGVAGLATHENLYRPPAEGPMADPTVCAIWVLGALLERWRNLNTQIDSLDNHLKDLVATAAPSLVELYGIGTHTAASLLIAAGDNPNRLTSESAFAMLCGAAPVPASSGKTNRHRLNRAGNRHANHALWRIALVRMAHHPATRAYVTRRTAEGLTKTEIIRCLKRYIAREIYPHLRRALHQATPTNKTA